MFKLMRSKTADPPWPNLYRGASVHVDNVGTCFVENRVSDNGRDYIVVDKNNNRLRITPTIMVVWSECQDGEIKDDSKTQEDKP